MPETLRDYFARHTYNGMLYFADAEMQAAGEDPEKKNAAILEICGILSSMQQEFARNEYVNQISKKFKIPKKEFTKAITSKVEERIKKDSENNELAKVPNRYRDDMDNYGFYEEGNQYWFAGEGGAREASNFVIEPLFHIYGKSNNLRLIRLINDRDKEAVIDVSSKGMVKLSQFEEIIFEEGDFLWYGSTSQYKRILRKIGRSFPIANQVTTLGWQRQGFFAFANGLCFGDGFKQINEYGIVEHDGIKYFLPAFSIIYANVAAEDDDYENDKHFRYESGNDIDFRKFAHQLDKVFGDKGRMAIAFLLACLFKDHIYKLYKFFPHLFLFGEKGSGKSFLAWRLNNLFFHGQPGFNLTTGTPVGFYRKLARTRNAVAWFDEYSNDIEFKRIQALKSSYDGFGHEKGIASQDNRTKVTKTEAGLVISGQYLPTADDNALFERSVLLDFPKRDVELNPYTKEERENVRMLEHWEEHGTSQIINEVMKHRELVERRFSNTYAELQEQLSAEITDGYTTRILNNFCVMLTSIKLLEKPLNLPFTFEDFYKQCKTLVSDQSARISESEGLATFWQTLEYLLDSQQIKEGVDFQFERRTNLTVMKNRTETTTKLLDGPTEILYIRLGKIHPLYMQNHRSQFGTTGIARASLQHYLKTNRAFLGVVKAADFLNQRPSAYAFEYSKLESMLNLKRQGKEVDAEETKMQTAAETEKIQTNIGQQMSTDDDLPF